MADPLEIFKKLDPELFKFVEESDKFAMSEGALPKKIKLLMAMILDASSGAVEGVKALANEAREAGATNQEIAESLRVVHYVKGVGSVYTAANALSEIFE